MDQLGKGATLYLKTSPSRQLCLVTDARKLLKVRLAGSGPLMMHCNGAQLSRSKFTAALRKAICTCGPNPLEFAAYSFHIEAATMALCWGLPSAHIKSLGHWHSSAYKHYVRARTAGLLLMVFFQVQAAGRCKSVTAVLCAGLTNMQK